MRYEIPLEFHVIKRKIQLPLPRKLAMAKACADRYAYLLGICTSISAIRTTNIPQACLRRVSSMFRLISYLSYGYLATIFVTVAFIKAAIHSRRVLVSVTEEKYIIKIRPSRRFMVTCSYKDSSVLLITYVFTISFIFLILVFFFYVNLR